MRPSIRILLLALAAVVLSLHGAERFPGTEWEKATTPEASGWSSARLEAAREYASTIPTAAVMVIDEGRVVYEWGETSRPFMCHSIRKSILSALYGPQVAEGRIDLSQTLAELGIDDKEPSLTDTEKQATIGDLIKARSGIYHAALYETPSMTASKPRRGSHRPGTFWHYNNWDFNALGTIFENLTGHSLYEEFEDRLADPLAMQDFVRAEHTGYYTGRQSVHPAYPFTLSARDLARFGLLFLRKGRWRDRQIIPEEWVTESTATHSKARGWDGYGYMWWTTPNGRPLDESGLPPGSYSARGAGGHVVYVIPSWDVVVVHRVNTFDRHQVPRQQVNRLLGLVLAARPSSMKLEIPEAEPPEAVVNRMLTRLAAEHPGEVYRLRMKAGGGNQPIAGHLAKNGKGSLTFPYDGTTDTLQIVETTWNGDTFEMELEGMGIRYTAKGKREGARINGQIFLGGRPSFRFEGALVQ